MRRWNPQPSIGLWIGVLLLLGTLIGIGFITERLSHTFRLPPSQWPLSLTVYGEVVAVLGLLALALLIAYRLLVALTLRYELDRNGLTITWAGHRLIIPMGSILQIEQGDPHARLPAQLLQGVGSYSGNGRSGSRRLLHLFSTRPPTQSLIIHTPTAVYAIAPNDSDSFLQQLEECRRLGVTIPLSQARQSGRLVGTAFWDDQTIRWSLLLALGVNLIMLGFLFASYQQLPLALPMQFDANGHAIDLRPRAHILLLPLAACVLSLINTALGLVIYRRNQIAAQLMAMIAVVVQTLFAVALLTTLP